MERRKRPLHSGIAGCAALHPGICAQESCGQGFIVERILANRRCRTGFEGILAVCGLPQGLHPPLRLCCADITGIRSVQGLECDACAVSRLALSLRCCVEDACGRRAAGDAQIEVQDCCAPVRTDERGANVRRGATIEVSRACFCAPCSFSVCMDICLHTVISLCEITGGCPRPCAECPALPLYPPPHCPPRC